VGGWDLKEEYEGGKLCEERRGEVTGAGREEDEHRHPRIGRQRSWSAEEVLRECEFVTQEDEVYPQEGTRKRKRKGGVYACRVCLRV
jgi:hypothetical protein